MSGGQRKISIRKVIQTLVTMIVVTGFTMAVVSADQLQRNKKVRNINIQIRNKHLVHFLDEDGVMKMLFEDRHMVPQQTAVGRLDIHRMEHIVRSNPWVSEAQIYVDNEQNLHVSVTQRVPVVRIYEESNNSYYLDTALKAMPVSERYVHYTPLVTGAPPLHDDSAGRALKGQILGLVRYVSANRFWNAQIAQIVVTPERSFELIPVLGKQRIILGDTGRLDKKLRNLLAFYTQVQNKVGWEKYELIDLRYEGQVVASPALKWKAPVDRALSNMNWVKAVMESGPKSDRDESVTNSDSTLSPAPAGVPAAAVAAAPKPKPVAVPAKPRPVPAVTAGAAGHKTLKPAAKPAKPAAHPQKDKKTAAAKPAAPKKEKSPRPKPGTPKPQTPKHH